ncbi:hypothetical protein [Clostridioides sp. ZZV15-6598]|uniref:hypothetical protein n=1 Tax=Clostridioides sp. ZZV15-6598 TaxID=2811501 RepID=UPI001D1056CD|nr:hypothetical protein [Clostridioides sp. ZZV15-6598]
MKKLAFFIPAIALTIFYGLAAFGGMGAIHPIVVLWLALLWIAGIFLSKTMFWGGLLGFIPGACFIYMGTQETGQIFKETSLGVIILLYYAVCIFYCIYKKKHSHMPKETRV